MVAVATVVARAPDIAGRVTVAGTLLARVKRVLVVATEVEEVAVGNRKVSRVSSHSAFF